MKLNKEKFMKTEMGGELEETIRTWDKALDEKEDGMAMCTYAKNRKMQ